jgi:hypothetical protein
MTTLLALRSPTSVADAYGVVTSAAWDLPIDEAAPDLVQRAQIQLLLTLKGGVARPSFTEVTFASSDIVGTFEVTRYPGVVGVFTSSYTPTGTVLTPPIGETFPDYIVDWIPDPTLYEVPDLRPADNGYMWRRGRVSPPREQARAYP